MQLFYGFPGFFSKKSGCFWKWYSKTVLWTLWLASNRPFRHLGWRSRKACVFDAFCHCIPAALYIKCHPIWVAKYILSVELIMAIWITLDRFGNALDQVGVLSYHGQSITRWVTLRISVKTLKICKSFANFNTLSLYWAVKSLYLPSTYGTTPWL